MEPIIRIEQLEYTYTREGATPVSALQGLNLTIHKGEYVAIVGHNGSGKSTLARHLNGLLQPTRGDVWVKGWNTKDPAHTLDIRSTVGMVFQSPDNQIVATIVEEDIAFGPENLGLAHTEIVQRVDWSLEQVSMQPFRKRAPHRLSGGQKQRICIAGVLAMRPEVIVLDEATAMLDPVGRKEVLAIARRLHREQGVTIVAITHFMEEALDADRIVVMAEGQIVLSGSPREIFRQPERLRELHLALPPIAELAYRLRQRIPDFPADLLTIDELMAALQERRATSIRSAPLGDERTAANDTDAASQSLHAEVLIATENLAHYYMRGTPLEVKAISDIDMEIQRGEILGIIGHTGSGKSTVVQHFNGLMRPHEGTVTIFGQELNSPNVDLQAIRRRVGLLFQFPESQLFEQFVGDDIAYGPRNLNLSREEIRERVRKAMEAVGLGFEEYKDRLTFSLSGGEKRRAALAGVLALEPDVLVLDEPTAGLDPEGRRQLLDHILALHQQGVTLVLISHNMEELAEVCHRLYVIADGHTVAHGTPAAVFAQADELQEIGLDVPVATQLMATLQQHGINLDDNTPVYTIAQAVERLTRLLGASA